jgi:hypothetical protein
VSVELTLFDLASRSAPPYLHNSAILRVFPPLAKFLPDTPRALRKHMVHGLRTPPMQADPAPHSKFPPRSSQHICAAPLIAVAAFAIAAVSVVPRASATLFTIEVTEQAGNVVANGTGAIDLDGLTEVGTGSPSDLIQPISAIIELGSTATIEEFRGLSGPATFGPGAGLITSSVRSGSFAGIDGGAGILGVPTGYVSGTPITDSATWDGATFASLGLTPGTYTWTWDSGADSLVVDIVAPAAVPEPASLALLASALAGLGAIRRRGRLKQGALGRG